MKCYAQAALAMARQQILRLRHASSAPKHKKNSLFKRIFGVKKMQYGTY